MNSSTRQRGWVANIVRVRVHQQREDHILRDLFCGFTNANHQTGLGEHWDCLMACSTSRLWSPLLGLSQLVLIAERFRVVSDNRWVGVDNRGDARCHLRNLDPPRPLCLDCGR